MIALTREPSGRRASTIGELSSTRRPTPLTMRSMTRIRCLSSWNVVGSRSSLPARSTYTCLCVLTRMSLMPGSRSNGSSGPSPKTSSMTSPRMRFALGHAERHRLFGDQIEEERANLGFGPRALGRGQRFEVQPVEQLPVNVRLELDILRPRRVGARWAAGAPGVGGVLRDRDMAMIPDQRRPRKRPALFRLRP